jgi:hypothetical protein
MNERIRELYDQALETKFDYGGGVGIKPGEYYSNYITVLNPEKFAELIVRECEQVSLTNSHRDDDMGAIIARQIRKHFGVE